jgi:hypothetical protein
MKKVLTVRLFGPGPKGVLALGGVGISEFIPGQRPKCIEELIRD